MIIPAEHRHDIIQSGIDFLRSITEAYGSEEGMKLWNTIANTLDPDVKGSIFFAMITGAHDEYIRIPMQSVPKRINAIRAVRTVDTRLGLKECKDLVESLEWSPIKIKVAPGERTNAIRILRDEGELSI